MSKKSLMLVLSMLLLLVSPNALAQSAISPPTTVPGVVALDLNDNLSDEEVKAVAAEYGALEETSYLSEDTRIYRVKVGIGKVKEFIQRLRKDNRVEHVEPLMMYYTRDFAGWTPNDPLLSSQWHMDTVGVERAWMQSTGRGVKVAVVDTGVTCEDRNGFHKVSDLANTKCITGYNFINDTDFAADDNGHGTHVAGTIAQSTNNALGGAGLAFHATIIPVKVLAGSGGGTHLQVADGIRFAADAGANVINMSLGGGGPSEIIHDAVKYARSKGVVVVCAAGNNGRFVEYPGAHPECFTVSATDSKNKIAYFSSRGPEVDIAAPGVDVLQQIICDGGKNGCEEFKKLNGTSMATPHVAGAAALLVGAGVTNPDMVEQILLNNTSSPSGGITRIITGGGNEDQLYGAGILNVGKALTFHNLKVGFVRLGLIIFLSLLLSKLIRKEDRIKKGWGYVGGAMLFGVGLLSLVPFVSSSVQLPLFFLAHPIPEWDLAFSANLHSYLPLATFAIPLALSTLFFGVYKARPFVAGVSVGTAAYMTSVIVLQLSSVSLVALSVWGVINVAMCLWIAFLNLKKDTSVE
jgi:serine protease